MPLPASDAFTDTNGVALTTHNAGWVLNNGNFDIQSNELAPNAATDFNVDFCAHWQNDTFANDQYAQAIASALVNALDGYIGLAVRAASGATKTLYNSAWAFGDQGYFNKTVTGTATSLGTFVISTWVVGDTIRHEAESTTIRLKRNGTNVISVTDSAISSGYAGVAGNNTSATTSRIDTWEGGNLGGGSGDGLSHGILQPMGIIS